MDIILQAMDMVITRKSVAQVACFPDPTVAVKNESFCREPF